MSQTSALRTATRPAPRPRPARRPAPALRVVPSAISRTGNAVFAGLCTLLLLAGLVTLLILNTSLAQGAFEASALQQRAGVLSDTQEQLTNAIDQQRSPRQLAARAQALGMVPGRSMAFIRLSDGAILGTATAASPSQALTNLGAVGAPATGASAPSTGATTGR